MKVYFIIQRNVALRQANGEQKSFCVLPTYSTFGEFNCIYNRKSSFYYTAVTDGANSMNQL